MISSSDVQKLKGRKVIVIGDVMIDEALFGDVSRISPEAPIPIVKLKNGSKIVPGGAANTANNVVSLGGKVMMIGVVGKDEGAVKLRKSLGENKIGSALFEDGTRPTITKTRIFGSAQGHQQQVIRLDREETSPIDNQIEEKIIQCFRKEITDSDAVILSDYNKGTLTRSLCQGIISIANKAGKLIIVDPKPVEVDRFAGCSLVTPNTHEAEQLSGIIRTDDASVQRMAKKIKEVLRCKYVIITLGKDGMFVFDDKDDHRVIPTRAREVIDVSGAGDTVISTLTLAMSAGFSIGDSADIANHAAGIVVAKPGTATATLEELEQSIADE